MGGIIQFVDYYDKQFDTDETNLDRLIRPKLYEMPQPDIRYDVCSRKN